MSFGQFLLYFLASEVVCQSIILSILFGRRALEQRRIQRMIKSGKVKVVTQDDLLAMLEEQDKKSWN